MSARIHIRNLMFNWGGHVAMLVVMFFLSPYIVGKLDAVLYGIWSLLNVLIGYMGIFDLGVRASVGRHVALYLGKKDEKGVNETIRAGLGFFSMTGLLILVVGVLLSLLFPKVFEGVPKEHFNTVQTLLPLMVVSVWMSAIAAIYRSVLAAHDRFDVARAVDLSVLLVRTIGTVWVLHLGWGLLGLAAAIIVSNFTALIGNYCCANHYHPGLQSWPLLYSRKRLKEIINYGLAAFITAVAVKIIGQSDLVIAGATISVSDVREYSIGAMLVYYSSTFLTLIGRTFFPSVQRAISSGAISEAKWLYGRQVRLALVFGICVYIGMATFSRPFIRLWMSQAGLNEESIRVAAIVMSILAVSKLPLLYTNAANGLLAAMGYIRYTATMTVLEAITNLMLSLVFVIKLQWELPGIAAGTLAARLIVMAMVIPLYAHAKIGLPFKAFFTGTFFPLLGVAICFGIVCEMVQKMFDPVNWSTFFVDIFVCVLIYSVILVPFLLPYDYRMRLIAFLKKGLKCVQAQ